MEHQLDATVTVLLISKISSTCFGQTFVHLQERKTEIFTTLQKPVKQATFIPYSAKQQRSETLPATSTGHYTICCKNLSLALLKMSKICPKHVELILEINKTVIVASSWCSILLYLYYVCFLKG
jgi:hypothetical protein